MKSRILSLLAAATFAVFAFTTAGSAQDCASQGGIVVSPGAGAVGFSQVTYLFEGASGDGLSGTGEVDVYVPILLGLLNAPSSGYINIVTDDAGWVTANLPILPGYYDVYGYENISTTFNLSVPAGQQVTSLNATVCYSSEPLAQITSGSSDEFSVESVEYNAEGQGDNLAAAPDPPPAPGPNFFPGGATQSKLQANHENVQTANNQCGPAAAANNFKWLKTTYGTNVPDPNDPGLRDIQKNGDNKIPLVGKLDMAMWSCGSLAGRQVAGNTVAAGRASGSILLVLPQLWGGMTYLANNKLNPTLKHQGKSNFSCNTPKGKVPDGFTGGNDVKFAGLTSKGQGVIIDPQFIYNEINGGSAVEYGDSYHVMDAVGAGSVKGAPYILYVSDHLQTDKDPNDNKGTLDDKGKVRIDFSWLCQPGWKNGQACMPDPKTASPMAVTGPENGALAVDVITQHP